MRLFGEGPWDVAAQHLPILRTCSFGPFSSQCREVTLEGGYTARPGPASTKTYPELRQRTDPFPIIQKSLIDWNALEDKKEFNRSILSYQIII